MSYFKSTFLYHLRSEQTEIFHKVHEAYALEPLTWKGPSQSPILNSFLRRPSQIVYFRLHEVWICPALAFFSVVADANLR